MIAAYHDTDTNLVMYVAVNMAFVNYIDQFNLTEKLPFQILANKTTSDHYFLMTQDLMKHCCQTLKH